MNKVKQDREDKVLVRLSDETPWFSENGKRFKRKPAGRPKLPLHPPPLQHPGKRAKKKKDDAALQTQSTDIAARTYRNDDGEIENGGLDSNLPAQHNASQAQHDKDGLPLVFKSVISIPARARFLLALARWPDKKAAAAVAGYHLSAFFRLKRGDPSFAELWDEAEAVGRAEWESRAQRRAFKGVRGRAIILNGKIVGYERIYSDRLAEVMLAAHDDKYSPRVRHSGAVAHLHGHQHTLAPELESLLRDAAGPERSPPPSRAAVIEARQIVNAGATAAPGLVDEALQAIEKAPDPLDVAPEPDK